MRPFALLLFLALTTLSVPASADFSSYAFVQDDGSLRISGRTVHLWGIHIPQTDQQCQWNVRPVDCAPRAVLALKFKVQGFVRCQERAQRPDGSIEATCRVDYDAFSPGTDLALYLIEYGWALATPQAPFEYHAAERIARSRGLGVWGVPVDSIR